jgi:hypothetical protein
MGGIGTPASPPPMGMMRAKVEVGIDHAPFGLRNVLLLRAPDDERATPRRLVIVGIIPRRRACQSFAI